MGNQDGVRAWGHELAFWVGLGSLFLLTTLATLLLWAVVPGWLPGWSSTVVLSGSMSPRIEAGDVVVWSATPSEEIGEGSVAVFLDEDGHRTLHRVVGHTDDHGLRTKGDANPTPDSAPVPPERVQGAGRVLVPLVGLPHLWLRDGRWAPLAALVVASVGAAWASRLCWAPEFDPWAAQAPGASAPGRTATARLPLWLPGATSDSSATTLLPPAARSLLLVTSGGDRSGPTRT